MGDCKSTFKNCLQNSKASKNVKNPPETSLSEDASSQGVNVGARRDAGDPDAIDSQLSDNLPLQSVNSKLRSDEQSLQLLDESLSFSSEMTAENGNEKNYHIIMG